MKHGTHILAAILLILAPTALAAGKQPVQDAAQTEPATEQTLSPKMQALADKVRRALAEYQARRLNTRDHGPWQIMHSTIGQGIGAKVLAGGPSGEPVTAIGWLCFNRPAYDQRLFFLSGDGLAARTGPGLQGHEAQMLAVLAQTGVKPDYPMRVSGRDFTVADLVEYEKATCMAGTELTYKLIGLSHYLPPGASWKNELGETWDVERLIREELGQPINGATCGGSHRLMGLSYALHRRAERGQPMTGEFARARKYIDEYLEYALALQNTDGSFSTDYFVSRASEKDDLARLETTGHLLEWIVFALPADSLEQPRVVKSVDYLARLLLRTKGADPSAGVLGHAVRGLMIYERRVFGDRSAPPATRQDVAKQASRSTPTRAPMLAP